MRFHCAACNCEHDISEFAPRKTPSRKKGNRPVEYSCRATYNALRAEKGKRLVAPKVLLDPFQRQLDNRLNRQGTVPN